MKRTTVIDTIVVIVGIVTIVFLIVLLKWSMTSAYSSSKEVNYVTCTNPELVDMRVDDYSYYQPLKSTTTTFAVNGQKYTVPVENCVMRTVWE